MMGYDSIIQVDVMAEIGKIESIRKMACPHCNSLIEDIDVEALCSGENVCCISCGKPIKLPESVMEKLRQSAYLGRNIDISC